MKFKYGDIQEHNGSTKIVESEADKFLIKDIEIILESSLISVSYKKYNVWYSLSSMGFKGETKEIIWKKFEDFCKENNIDIKWAEENTHLWMNTFWKKRDYILLCNYQFLRKNDFVTKSFKTSNYKIIFKDEA